MDTTETFEHDAYLASKQIGLILFWLHKHEGFIPIKPGEEGPAETVIELLEERARYLRELENMRDSLRTLQDRIDGALQ